MDRREKGLVVIKAPAEPLMQEFDFTIMVVITPFFPAKKLQCELLFHEKHRENGLNLYGQDFLKQPTIEIV